ncbi:MAG: DUF5696 domain-containing protein [Oscillospiraceae bacterium]|jgi:hypothetical protein|nr:DUF5696 domain-containing protein [Oscillospiraceae bacterium]
MKHSHKYRGPLALAPAVALLLLSAGCGGKGAGLAVHAGQPLQADEPGRGPHTAASVMGRADPLARSGWLELFLDDASKTVSIRSHSEAEWSALPRSGGTPQANLGACAVEIDAYANGRKLTLNSQDHSVAYKNAAAQNVKDARTGEGVEIAYTLTPDQPTADRAKAGALAAGDVAFLVRVRYTLLEGNFRVQADWENLSENPNAFIAAIGLMERFGALRSPGPNDFFLLPDGCGALLYPARQPEASTEDLRFAVYGEDPSNPSGGEALRANVAAWGVRGQGAGFIAVAEQGAALCEIAARQSIPGEIPQAAVGPRFAVTPVDLRADGTVARRAPASYGQAEGESLSVVYRFFNGDSANFNTMATACREQLISSGVLSSTKTVRDSAGPPPLALTLLCTGPAQRFGLRALTTFEQAQDILMRLKNKGVNSMNVRLQSALSGGWLQMAPERVSPLLRLGGALQLNALQEYCKSKGLTLFLDVRAYSSKGLFALQARGIAGQPLRAVPRGFPWGDAGTIPLRAADSYVRASRAILTRLGKFGTAGVALGGVGNTLYADYSGPGSSRTRTVERQGQLLPALSARWTVMLDTGDFYAVRYADAIANLPLEPQLQMPGGRYVAVPLVPILLHSSADYAGAPLNLSDDPKMALLRAVAYGACPAFTWTADERGDRDKQLAFEAPFDDGLNAYNSQLDYALHAYHRASAALEGLRGMRITGYEVDAATGVSVTRYSNDAAVYVNYGAEERTLDEITVPPMDFVRIG